MIDKNSNWQTHTGKIIPLKDLTDTHLANIIDFVKSNNMKNGKLLLKTLRSIAKDRGLTTKFLGRSQIPYKNENNKWEIWDKKNSFIEIEK